MTSPSPTLKTDDPNTQNTNKVRAMDFTPPSNPNPIIPIMPIQQQQQQQEPNPISSSIPIPSSGTKLPIKRKTLTPPKLESSSSDADADPDPDHDVIARQPPFKFHRIWTEPDEIRFLQGLLDCSSQGLSFPRDLGIFYTQFSHGMSQPYTKSQLSEKLRRLRKKFRVISSRLSKGLDKAMLSPQDRALYDLSKQLWEPDQPSDDHNCKSDSVSVRVRASASASLSPPLPLPLPLPSPSPSMAVLALPSVIKETNNRSNIRSSKFNNVDLKGDVKVNVEVERNVDVVRKEVRVESGVDDVMRYANRTLADVIGQSLEEIRMVIDVQRNSSFEKEMSFEKRWREQYVAEFDVLAKRLKLIVEHSSLVSK